ncbi:MAG: glycosyltransferase, partial [Ferruginibacter sp.]
MQLTTGTQRITSKILFVSMPADGHFNPLTGWAKHLQSIGCDVRWYTQDLYKDKLAKLQIQHYPYVNAPQLNQLNFEQFFTDRVRYKSQTAKFKFDLEHCFIRPVPAILKDIENIHATFPFDLVVADIMSFCIPLIKATFHVPVIAAGIIPLMETSASLPPAG